jgi:hypothetical protein
MSYLIRLLEAWDNYNRYMFDPNIIDEPETIEEHASWLRVASIQDEIINEMHLPEKFYTIDRINLGEIKCQEFFVRAAVALDNKDNSLGGLRNEILKLMSD